MGRGLRRGRARGSLKAQQAAGRAGRPTPSAPGGRRDSGGGVPPHAAHRPSDRRVNGCLQGGGHGAPAAKRTKRPPAGALQLPVATVGGEGGGAGAAKPHPPTLGPPTAAAGLSVQACKWWDAVAVQAGVSACAHQPAGRTGQAITGRRGARGRAGGTAGVGACALAGARARKSRRRTRHTTHNPARAPTRGRRGRRTPECRLGLAGCM